MSRKRKSRKQFSFQGYLNSKFKGIDAEIRNEVWPFLLGVYDWNTARDEREILKSKQKKEYEIARNAWDNLLQEVGSALSLNDKLLSGNAGDEPEGFDGNEKYLLISNCKASGKEIQN